MVARRDDSGLSSDNVLIVVGGVNVALFSFGCWYQMRPSEFFRWVHPPPNLTCLISPSLMKFAGPSRCAGEAIGKQCGQYLIAWLQSRHSCMTLAGKSRTALISYFYLLHLSAEY